MFQKQTQIIIVKIKIDCMKNNIFTFLLLFAISPLLAQQIPVIIQDGTFHLGNGQVMENGYLVMLEGRIAFVGKELPAFYKNAKVIQATGKHIYPGFICMNTYVGLNEIDAVRATRDYQEVGLFNPNARALIAYNTDSKIIPTVRFNGITHVQAVPQGGVISGSSSVMKTTGWNWEDAAVLADDGIHLNWPEHYIQTGWWAEPGDIQKTKTREQVDAIADFFRESKRYSMLKNSDKVNLRYESMRGIFNSSKNVYVHINSTKGILSAIQFFKNYPEIKWVLMGASDAWKVADLIKENNIPVVLNQLHRLPNRNADDVDLPFKLPYLLMQRGIQVAIAHGGSWESRNVMFNAGTAAANGLTKEQALMCITSIPAKIMGLKDAGTLEQGKQASIIISEGDALDMRTNKIEWMFINGEAINNKNQQVDLYEKYINKYGLKP
jgi:imidazolonepropionase-like amidohydrolase